MAVRRSWNNGRRGPNGRAAPFLLRRHLLLQEEQPSRGISLLVTLLVAGALLVLVMLFSGVAAAAGVYFYYAGDLEGELAQLETRDLFETSRIYDRNGILLYEVFREGRRTRIDSLEMVPQPLIWATIAIEDETFFDNPGVDIVGITRAALAILRTGEIQGGGSTLTQQFIRNALFPPEYRYNQSFDRKIREAILSLELTRTFTKEEILLMFFNEISYGNLSYGIEAAAQGYFGRHVWELDLAECAFLAGLPQSPTTLNPFFEGGLERAKDRQYQVLRQMVENGYITQDEADAAYREELAFSSPLINIEAPHFVMYILELFEEGAIPGIGSDRLYGGGLSIYTTLDMRYQQLAEAIIQQRMSQEDMEYFNVHNAALVAMRPASGEILAMVGSVDYNLVRPSVCGREGNVVDGNVNAALADRQPGSSFKLFTYLTAFSQPDGLTAASMVLDVHTLFPIPGQEPYDPVNYTSRWYGPVRLRNALGSSLNIPAVKVIQFAGVGETIEMAHRLGITTLQAGAENYGLSLTLGGGEVRLLDMVNSFATIANEGRPVPPAAVLRIVDAAGDTLYEYDPPPLEEVPEVVDPRYVYLLTNILSDDAARQLIFGAHSFLELSRPAGVKTGTSEYWRDNWTVGFTPYLTVGAWAGNNNGEPMIPNCPSMERVLEGHAGRGVPGVTTAGRIWHYFMEAIFHPEQELPRYFPDEETRLSIFGSGEIDLEDILRDEEGNLRYNFRRPSGIENHQVCAVSGMRPTPYCPVVDEIFVAGTEPREPCTVHRLVTVVQFPGTDPPVYCLPVDGVEYPPELVHEQVFLDLHSVARPEEVAGLDEWIQEAGIPRIPTDFCPPDMGTPLPGQPGQPGQPPVDRWAGLVRQITFPGRYRGVTGPIEIRGSADLTSPDPRYQFSYYVVEWGPKPSSEMPTEWYNVAPDVSRTPVHNGVLAVWDPGMLPDGSYVIRLRVVSNSGEVPGYAYVPVYVDRGSIYVRMLSPQPGSVLAQETVTLVAKLEGVSPARRVDFFYDGIYIGTAVTNTVYPLSERIYTVTWPVRPGEHRLQVEVVNTAGRRAMSQPVLVIGRPPGGQLPGSGSGLAAALPPDLTEAALPPPMALREREGR